MTKAPKPQTLVSDPGAAPQPTVPAPSGLDPKATAMGLGTPVAACCDVNVALAGVAFGNADRAARARVALTAYKLLVDGRCTEEDLREEPRLEDLYSTDLMHLADAMGHVSGRMVEVATRNHLEECVEARPRPEPGLDDLYAYGLVLMAVEDLQEGDQVDLESCPFLQEHPTAPYEFATVACVGKETQDCIMVGYEGLDQVGYAPGTKLRIQARVTVEDLTDHISDVKLDGCDAEHKAMLELLALVDGMLETKELTRKHLPVGYAAMKRDLEKTGSNDEEYEMFYDLTSHFVAALKNGSIKPQEGRDGYNKLVRHLGSYTERGD